MQYMLLIYDNENLWAEMPDGQKQSIMQDYFKFTDDIVQSGHFKAGDPLEPTHTATSVRMRDGKTLTTDGPFAETKEQLGGYYLVEAEDLDEAISIAARIPSAAVGTIEVRPIMRIER